MNWALAIPLACAVGFIVAVIVAVVNERRED